MIVDSDCVGLGAIQDEDLMTPLIDASSASAVTLQFDHHFKGYFMDGVNDDFGTVRVRSALTGGAWSELIQWDENDDTGVETITLDVTAECAGASDCQFGWRYEGDYDWYWGVDNVIVDGVGGCSPVTCSCPALDAAVISDISPNPACDGGTITFTAQAATGGVAPYTYRWDFEDDGTYDATGQTVTNVYGGLGPYTVRLQVEDSCGVPGPQTQETTGAVTVNPQPMCIITPDPAEICDGTSVSFCGSGGTYQWDFEDDGFIDETTVG
jgi:hypothetical protein